jgi:hypothetical protein
MIAVRPTENGVDFTDGDRSVRADTSAHTVRLVNHAGATVELGALRTGLLTAMGFVAETFGLRLGSDCGPVARAITRALAAAAARRGVRDAALEAGIDEICATPLLYSAPFLEARYVWQDALRFRPCRVAIARAEDDFIDEDAPETAARVVAALGRWRDLYAARGKASRALNAALTDFGDILPADALWGLRKVPLGRPRTRAAPLELLGWLGALPGVPQHERIVEIVERASDADMDALLDGRLDDALAQPRAPRELARLLADGDPDSRTLLQLVRSALAEQAAPRARTFPDPPIPPPDDAEIRLLRTPAELRKEGERMHHCVASLMRECLRGDAFIFHVEHEDTHATIHVDRHGRVVQARGPFNRPSVAARRGAARLLEWGASLAWPIGLPATAGVRPLRSVRALRGAYETLWQRQPDRLRQLTAWFNDATERAVAGEIGCFVVDGDADRVWVAAADGSPLGNSDAPLPPRPGRPPARARDPFPVMPVVELPVPPIPPPQWTGVRLLRSSAQLGVNDVTAIERAAGRRSFLFEVRLDDYAPLFFEVGIDESVQALGASRYAGARVEEASQRLRLWARNFWALRIGLQRSTWCGDVRAPAGSEPLRTVEDCFVLYRSLCDRVADVDGRRAVFFERHCGAAVRASAWIVARDRSAGIVYVLDGRGRVIDSLHL